MDFKQYNAQKGEFFNMIFQKLPVHLKNELRDIQMCHKPSSDRMIIKLMIFNWAASIVKTRLTENQMYLERDKILKADPNSDAEYHNQEYARLAYTWAIFYRRFLDKKIASQHTDIISMASRDMALWATRIRNGLRRSR